MAKTIEKLGSAKRFGPRYGRRPKEKFAKIEKELRRRHKCPYCHTLNAKRLSMGIWYCSKCKTKFTGKAYSIEKKITFDKEEKEAPKPDIEEIKEED